MAVLPLEDAIPRFKENEDRINTFANGTDAQSYTTSGAVPVPSILKFLSDQSDMIQAQLLALLIAPGPYANDAAAATAGVSVGGLYRKTGGSVAWRQS